MTVTMASARVVKDDLPADLFGRAQASEFLAWDIETSGLDWSRDAIGTCQIATEDWAAVVVLRAGEQPKRLATLLEDASVRKIFHHAPFDLRFMTSQWRVDCANVACTKIASKILDPRLGSAEHSLQPVLRRHLGVEISKAEQVSDWLSPILTDAQIKYAITDVVHLIRLYRLLDSKCRAAGVHTELMRSFEYLPTRVALDIRGSGDVFAY